MKKNTNYYVISGIFLLIVFLFLPIEYPVTVASKGKLLAIKSWTLAKGTDGRLVTSLMDNSTGINNEFSVTQFERGDAVKFNLNLDVVSRNYVLEGDSIGYIISNEIEKEIEQLKGKLKVARASLNVQLSSEKESVIEAEKNKLDFAEMQLEEQTKIYNRKKLLFEKQLISQQEFEADDAKYELAKINISIAEERLRTVQSGGKKEEVSYAASRITAFENEINVLRKRFENNIIISPIGGIINRSFSSDTLLIVNDTSSYVILLPILWEEANKISKDQHVEISSNNLSETGIGKILSVDGSIKNYGGKQFVVVTVVSSSKFEGYKTGLIVDCKIYCGSTTAMGIVTDYLKPIFN